MAEQTENKTEDAQRDPEATVTDNSQQPQTNATADAEGSADDGDKKKRDNIQWYMGLILIVAGLVGLLTASLAGKALGDNGGLAAASMMFVLLGIAFFFPDLLKAPDDSFSTMRVIVFIIVAVFVVLCVKIGWSTSSFDALRIDSSWVYILGLAFGSKVFQSFGEKNNG